MKNTSKYKNEEWLNAFSHALGAILAIFGLFLLLDRNAEKSAFATFSILVYSATLISMFTMSTTYHLTSNSHLKKKLRVLDHINIYFLIAGTYTPVALITLITGSGWALFYAVWIIAACGMAFKIFYTGKLEFLSLILYIIMGWLIIIDFDNLIENLSSFGLHLLLLGGAFYTFGILFYALEQLPYNHFIWHIFVLGGAFSHWLMIFSTVV